MFAILIFTGGGLSGGYLKQTRVFEVQSDVHQIFFGQMTGDEESLVEQSGSHDRVLASDVVKIIGNLGEVGRLVVAQGAAHEGPEGANWERFFFSVLCF